MVKPVTSSVRRSQPQSMVLAPGYAFATVADFTDTISGQSANVHGTATKTFGPYGQQMTFPGGGPRANYVDYGDLPSFQDLFKGPCTLHVLCRPTTYATTIASKGDASTHGWQLYFAANTQLGFKLSDTGADTVCTSTVGGVTNDGSLWQLFTITYDGGAPGSAVIHIYNNGVDVTNSTTAGGGTNGSDVGFNLFVGATNGSVGDFQGDIAFVAATRRQLNAGEVKSVSDNPWQIFAKKRNIQFNYPAFVNPTTTINTGTGIMTMNGVQANVSASVTTTINATLGQMTMTGVSPNIVNLPYGGLNPLPTPTISVAGSPWGIISSPDSKFIYVANSGQDEIGIYSKDPTTGQLTFVQNQLTVSGGHVRKLVISPDGAFLYASNWGTNNISMYSRNTSTGLLTSLSTATIATGTNPFGMVITPDGLNLYCSNGDGVANNIQQYARDNSTGLLTALSTPTVARGHGGWGTLVASPDSNYVYATNFSDFTISQFSRGGPGAAGLLSPLSPATIASTKPAEIAMTSDGVHVYCVDDDASNVVCQFSRNAGTGLLSQLSPINITALPGQGLWGIALTPDNKYLYATGSDNNMICQYSANTSTGLLAQLTIKTVASGSGPYNIVVTPDGQYAYASIYNDNVIDQFSINLPNVVTPVTANTGIMTLNGLAASVTISAPSTTGVARGSGGISVNGGIELTKSVNDGTRVTTDT